jgi:hypothetical protein
MGRTRCPFPLQIIVNEPQALEASFLTLLRRFPTPIRRIEVFDEQDLSTRRRNFDSLAPMTWFSAPSARKVRRAGNVQKHMSDAWPVSCVNSRAILVL